MELSRRTHSAKPSPFSIPLSLGAKLSQTYLHEVILGFVLAISCLCVLQVFIHKHGDEAKYSISRACSELEIGTNALASTPYFVAKGVNRLVTDSIDSAKRHSAQLVRQSLFFLKDLLLYILFRYQKVLQCLLYLIVTSGLQLVAKGAQEVSVFVNNQLGAISSALDQGLKSLNNQLSSINDASSHLSINAFGVGASVPKIPLPISIPGVSDRLSNWALPNSTLSFLSSFSQGQQQLPSLQELESSAKRAISVPIDSLIDSISTSLNDALNISDAQRAFTMIPLPPVVDSIKFCDGILPMAAIDKAVAKFELVLWICIAVLGSLVLIVAIWNGRSIYLDYRSQQARADRLLSQIKKFDYSAIARPVHMAIQYPALDAFLSRHFGDKLSDLQLWIILYCSNRLAWLCIIVGAIGLFVVQMQLVLIPLIANLLAPVLLQEINQSADLVGSKVSLAINQAVGPYISAVNNEISRVEDALNDNVVGAIKTVVSSIDSGVMAVFASFQDDVSKALDSVPPLKSAVSSFFSCLLGNVSGTITTLEANLRNNSFINISRLTPSHFSLDASVLVQRGNIGKSFSNLANSSASNGARAVFQNQIDGMLRRYASTIRFQSIPFLVMLVFGGSMLVIALFAALVSLLTTPRRPLLKDEA